MRLMEILLAGAIYSASSTSIGSMFGLLGHVPLLALWITLFFLSYGILGLNFLLMRRAAKKPWKLSFNKEYTPRVTIIVPTYNESKAIAYKLKNLSILDYPRNLTQIIVVDSNSEDNTNDQVRGFISQHPDMNIRLLIDSEAKGKSAALNLALKCCEGEIVLISDADCFWPPEILHESLPFLADPNVGAISGQKILLNSGQSWVTKTEDSYLNAVNQMKLGESKLGSTVLFEGGFSAYKKEVLESFDPWNTG
jgi:biofilm PGA synthesis N-glycosyltransferase PgaC